jgi:ADP-dependent phosphofructokinase/glucokinase
MAKHLAATGDAPVLYTPEVSGKLADRLGDRILCPEVEEGRLVLRNVEDCVNSERTKKNLIFEYSGDRDGRIIFSSELKGFGPYFDSELEPHLEQLDSKMDRFLLSGFHDAEGNVDAKLEKARRQLREIDTPVHHEYVHRPEKAETIVEKILSEVESVGLDARELRKLSDTSGVETEVPDDPSLGESFAAARKLIEHLELDRIHIHTLTHHVVVASESYPVSKEEMRKGLLYGVASGAEMCQQGSYPSESEIEDFSMHGRELHGVQELRDFGEFFNLGSFTETGIAKIEGLKVAAVPSLIVEEPEKLVGLGDVISCGSFVGETKQPEGL